MEKINLTDFKSNYLPVFNEIFCGCEPVPESFSDYKWKLLLLHFTVGYTPDLEKFLEALEDVFSENSVIMSVVETIPPHLDNVVISKNDNLNEIVNFGSICGLDSVMFGAKSKWGAMFSVEDYCIFGSEPAFTEKIAGFFGGWEKCRAEFEDFADEYWYISDKVRKNLSEYFGWNF